MKKRIVGVALVVGSLATLTAAQETMKEEAPPKPAVGPSQVLLENWNDIGRKLIAMAEDFPEDKYDFKPVPAVRSFVAAVARRECELFLHQSGNGAEAASRRRSQT